MAKSRKTAGKKTGRKRAAAETPEEREAREIREAHEDSKFARDMWVRDEEAMTPEERFDKRWMRDRQFTLADAAQLLGESKPTVWAAIDRGTVPYRGERPGSGSELALSGYDIVQMRFAFELAKVGVPRRVSLVTADLIEGRIAHVLVGNEWEKVSVLIAPSSGDWEYQAFSVLQSLDPEKSPLVGVVVRVDELIAAQIEQIRALAARKEQIETLRDAGPIPSKFDQRK